MPMRDHEPPDWEKVQDGRLRAIKPHGAETGRWRSDGRVKHTVYPIKYMVVTGELTTGFTFYGPFDTMDKAGQWATANLRAGTFHRVHTMYDVGGGG